MSRVRFLEFYEDVRSRRPATYIETPIAGELVRRMFAERISKGVIRAFSPDSPFPTLKAADVSVRGTRPRAATRLERLGIIAAPGPLAPAELPGVYFALPDSAAQSYRVPSVFRSRWMWLPCDGPESRPPAVK